MEWGLNWCIGTKSHHLVVAHAAVVERNGRTLILPAHSGSGKSTLCAALTYSGWRLFSDEFALIDPRSGMLSPAPRPISLKGAAIELIAGRHPDVVYGPEELDVEGDRFVHARPPADSVRRAQEQASAGWIVFPKYAAGSPTMLEPMPKAHALMELTGQSFNYNYLANGYLCLAELVRRTDCYTLEYSSLDDVLDRLTVLTST
jgi:HprK-related kinase A